MAYLVLSLLRMVYKRIARQIGKYTIDRYITRADSHTCTFDPNDETIALRKTILICSGGIDVKRPDNVFRAFSQI